MTPLFGDEPLTIYWQIIRLQFLSGTCRKNGLGSKQVWVATQVALLSGPNDTGHYK